MFKINIKSGLNVGDMVKFDHTRTKGKEKELMNYNLPSSGLKIIKIVGRIVDLDDVFQPTLSKDFLGVKIHLKDNQFWILPKWCLSKINENKFKN